MFPQQSIEIVSTSIILNPQERIFDHPTRWFDSSQQPRDLSYLLPRTDHVCHVTTFVMTGGTLTPRRVFTTLSLVGVIADPMLSLFERGIFQFAESRVGGSRIQVRLLSDGFLADSGGVPSLRECVRPLCRAVKCVCTPSLDFGCFTKAKLLNHVKGS